MARKFIITNDGTLVFGEVELHRDLIPEGDDTCHGGGMWRIDNQRGVIVLSGRSFDFGSPDFTCFKRVDRSSGPGLLGYPILYRRDFDGEEMVISEK